MSHNRSRYGMPPPFEYQNASLQFEKFLLDARDLAGLATTNMAWNMIVGVLHTFRSRLNPKQVALFASVLPPVARALFVEDWDPEKPVLDFSPADELIAEVRAVRHEHNFAPDNAIEAVAVALRRNLDEEAFDRILGQLPEGAKQYWRGVKPAA